MAKPYKIIIAPLDWGLGHATRIIPLIKCLLTEGCAVIIAAEGQIGQLLQNEFPNLTFLPLEGYKIEYAKQKKRLLLKIAIQTPGILFSIYKEHVWLKKVVKNYAIDAVISDNRFGLYHSNIPSVYITHQLLIKTRNKFSENILARLHHLFIKKYTECWVPDFKGDDNISGALSHPAERINNIKYIGCLSRFEKSQGVEIKYDLIVLLSGPEPQRSIFEKLLLVQLNQFSGQVLLVRGKPVGDENLHIENNSTGKIQIKNHLNAAELNLAIQQAKVVICRSGYTTIMDLIKLQKKAILIPTPGQTEQEYLAAYLMKKKLFYIETQDKFLLEEALKKLDEFSFLLKGYDMEQYKKTVHQFIDYIAGIKKRKNLANQVNRQ